MIGFSKDGAYGRFLKRYFKFVSKHAGIILVIYLSIMGYFVYESRFIKLDSNLYSLFPQKMKSLQNLQKMQSTYGGTGSLVLSVKIPHNDEMLSNLLPRYIDLNQQFYLRDFAAIKNRTVRDVSQSDQSLLADDIKDYYSEMDNYYIPAFQNELKVDANKKYTTLFLKEYTEIVKPDLEEKWTAFLNSPNKQSLLNLEGAFLDNVSSAKLYLSKIGESLPPKREELLKDFADRYAIALKASPSVVFVDYAFNQKFVEDHLLYFIDESDIHYIQNQLQERIDYERRKNLLSSFLLMDENKADLHFQMLRDKYVRTRGEGISRKFIRLQNPDAVLDGTNRGQTKQYYLSDTKDSVVLNLRVSRGAIDVNYALKILEVAQDIFNKVQKQNSAYKVLNLVPTGDYVDRRNDVAILNHDLSRLTPIALLFVCGIIALYFQNILAIFVVTFPLLSGMLSALGFVRVAFGHLNLVSSFLVAIISGLGVNLGTHLLARYLEEKERGLAPKDALFEVFTSIFISNITATLTTAVGFFVLAISSFKGFREFGIIAGVGMITLLFGIILAFPTLTLWLESRGWFRIKVRKKRSFESYRGAPFPLYKLWCFLGAAFLTYSLFVAKDINFNANFTSLVKKNNHSLTKEDYYRAGAYQILKLSGTSGVIPIYAPNLAVYKDLDNYFMKGRFANNSGFRIESFFTYAPQDQKTKRAAIDSLSTTLQSGLLNANDDEEIQNKIDFLKRIVKTPFSEWQDIPVSLKGPFLGIKPGYFLLYYALEVPKSVSSINRYYTDFERLDQEYKDKGVFLASDIWIFGELIKVLKKEGILLFIAIMVAFVVLLWFDFYSLKRIFIVLLPLFAGFLGMIGFCVLADIEWNFFNVLMFPVIAGLGIDYGVHMLHRIQEEGTGNLRFVFETTGKTMWAAALQDMVGFGVLVLALYYGLVTIGQVLMVGVFCCLLAGSLLMPSILEWREDIKRKGFVKSFFSLEGWFPVFLSSRSMKKKGEKE